jgi:hypothetical protein
VDPGGLTNKENRSLFVEEQQLGRLDSGLSEDVTLLGNSALFSKYALLRHGVRNDCITHQAAHQKSNFTDVYNFNINQRIEGKRNCDAMDK